MWSTSVLNFSVILLTIPLMLIEAQNYCNANLCRNGKKHIACNNSGAVSSNCGSNTTVITITDALRTSIVNNHNKKRNYLAGGNLGNYKAAKRMATMQWNAELAKLAVLNVKQCVMQHDGCRSTSDYPLAGQNLAVTNWYGTTKTVQQIVNEHIQLWWDEYKDCSMSYITKYRNPPSGAKAIGHFTQMAQERATRVGCGILRTVRGTTTYQYMACNYAFTNFIDEAVYRAGTTASLCKTGRNSVYKNLCSRSESYNVKSGSY